MSGKISVRMCVVELDKSDGRDLCVNSIGTKSMGNTSKQQLSASNMKQLLEI